MEQTNRDKVGGAAVIVAQAQPGSRAGIDTPAHLSYTVFDRLERLPTGGLLGSMQADELGTAVVITRPPYRFNPARKSQSRWLDLVGSPQVEKSAIYAPLTVDYPGPRAQVQRSRLFHHKSKESKPHA
jgi:hypothetical protein